MWRRSLTWFPRGLTAAVDVRSTSSVPADTASVSCDVVLDSSCSSWQYDAGDAASDGPLSISILGHTLNDTLKSMRNRQSIVLPKLHALLSRETIIVSCGSRV